MAASIAKDVNNNSISDNNNPQLNKWHSSQLENVIQFNYKHALPDRYASNYKGYSNADEVHIGTKTFLLKHFNRADSNDGNGRIYTRKLDVLEDKDLTDVQLILKNYFNVVANVVCKRMKEALKG